MNFQSPRRYSQLKQGESLEYEIDSHGEKTRLFLPTFRLPAKTFLYRTDLKNETLSETVPNFFTNLETAHKYQTKKNTEVITKYEVIKDAKLLNLNIQSILQLQTLFQKLLDELRHQPATKKDENKIRWFESSLNILKLYLADEEDGVYPTIPASIYRSVSRNSSTAQYLNRDVANIICSLGLDGWVVMPYNQNKGEGLLEYSIQHDGRPKFVDYYPEIMLCTHQQYLKNVGSVSRKNLRYTIRHSHRQTRRHATHGQTRRHGTHGQTRRHATHGRHKHTVRQRHPRNNRRNNRNILF